MSAIGPGDWVEYVDDGARPGEYDYGRILVLHALYRVHDVVPGHFYEDGQAALELVEVPDIDRDGFRFSFAVDRFRPVYRPKSDLIETLKQPAPDAVRELIDA